MREGLPRINGAAVKVPVISADGMNHAPVISPCDSCSSRDGERTRGE